MVIALNNKLFNSPKILWEEKATAFLVANALPKISGAWKLMLLGDGSPTRHLQLLTNHETKIKLISMQIYRKIYEILQHYTLITVYSLQLC